MSTTVVCCEVAGGAVQTNHHFSETRTTLTLKLSSFETQIETSLNSHSCWDFQNLTSSVSTSSSSSSYIPPATNKSLIPNVCLELCTENLGSESGSDTSDHSNILSLLMSPSCSSSTPHQQPKQSKSGAFKKMHPPASRSFPPPLTTIRGIHPIRVRPKREGGRLLIEAVEETKPCSYFRSERSHGHLRLCFWDDNSSGSGSDHEEDEENEKTCDDQDQIEEEEEEDEEEEGLNVRVEIGSQKSERRSSSRCKESRGSCNSKGGLCNWKPFWVAT